jgi:hypothetical protein
MKLEIYKDAGVILSVELVKEGTVREMIAILTRRVRGDSNL